MGQGRQPVVTLFGMVLGAVPLSIVTTILLFPLWTWLEASTGIESVGHSGPAHWCYAAVFLVLVTAGTVIVRSRYRAKGSRSDPAAKTFILGMCIVPAALLLLLVLTGLTR